MASRVDKIYGDAYISVKTDEDALIEALEEVANVEKAPKLEGRNMFTILAKKNA